MAVNARTFLVLAVAAAVSAGVGGCSNKQSAKAEDESQCKAVKPGTIVTVNRMCAVVNEDPVNPTVEPVVWKGQKVGFCCDGCKPRWAKMTAAEKDAALAKAIATPVPE